MSQAINSFFSALPNWLHIIFISMIPAIELRVSIPYGILLLQMPFIPVLIYSIIGSIIPAPFIMYFGEKVLAKLESSENTFLSKLGQKIYGNSMRKRERIEKYSYLGLMFFVSIPLPGTGVWTGCMIAALLKLDPVKSVLFALAGTTIAGIVVSLLVKGGILLVSV